MPRGQLFKLTIHFVIFGLRPVIIKAGNSRFQPIDEGFGSAEPTFQIRHHGDVKLLRDCIRSSNVPYFRVGAKLRQHQASDPICPKVLKAKKAPRP